MARVSKRQVSCRFCKGMYWTKGITHHELKCKLRNTIEPIEINKITKPIETEILPVFTLLSHDREEFKVIQIDKAFIAIFNNIAFRVNNLNEIFSVKALSDAPANISENSKTSV